MTTVAEARLLADIDFAIKSGEFASVAPMLRYVAAINPEVTCQQFVSACVAKGFRANSAANRFRESRKFDAENYGD